MIITALVASASQRRLPRTCAIFAEFSSVSPTMRPRLSMTMNWILSDSVNWDREMICDLLLASSLGSGMET